MKLSKCILALFTISAIFALSSAEAGTSISFTNIEIPSLKRIYKSSQYIKDTGTKQYVKTIDMEAPMEARTYAVYDPVGYTSWVSLVKGSEINWGSQNNKANQYRLEIRCKSNHITSKGFWGSWKYNWPS